MSFLSKVLKVATGGLSGPIGSLARGDVRGAGIGALTGGVLGGRRGARGPMGPMAVDPGAQAYFNTFSPEDQQNIQAGLVGQQNGLNNWFRAAQAAGAVPTPPTSTPPAAMTGIRGMPRSNPMIKEIALARRKFQAGRMGSGGYAGPRRMME